MPNVLKKYLAYLSTIQMYFSTVVKYTATKVLHVLCLSAPLK